jgi:hypothetical protein
MTEYRVGVDYHAFGADHSAHNVVTHYNQPGVRDQVRAQLRGMVDGGAGVIKTILWFGDNPASPGGDAALFAFPPTAQQLANLHAYVGDVGATLGSDGQPPELYISTDYIGYADFTQGSPSIGLGSSHLSAAAYGAALNATFDGVLAALGGIYRPDGRPVVTLMYFHSEVVACSSLDNSDPICTVTGGEKPNQRWFLSTFYPGFITKARSWGIIPSVYFILSNNEQGTLMEGYVDSYLPALNGHQSVSQLYRSIKYMKNAGLPLPERVDFTVGAFDPIVYTTPATIYDRELDDLEAVLPEFYSTIRYAAVEAPYFTDPTLRVQHGKALAAERLLRGSNPEVVAFWTTPQQYCVGCPNIDVGPPYDLSAFDATNIVTPFATLNPSFETPGANGLPAGYTTPVPAGTMTNASRYTGSDVLDGIADLRLNAAACPSCTGVLSDAVSAMGGQIAVFRLWERSAFPPMGVRPPHPSFVGPTISLRGFSSGVFARSLLDFGIWNSNFKWRRYVGVAPIPSGVDSLRLQFGLQGETTGVVDVDKMQ